MIPPQSSTYQKLTDGLKEVGSKFIKLSNKIDTNTRQHNGVSSMITKLSSKIDTSSKQHTEKLTDRLNRVNGMITKLSSKIDTTYIYCRTSSPRFSFVQSSPSSRNVTRKVSYYNMRRSSTEPFVSCASKILENKSSV